MTRLPLVKLLQPGAVVVIEHALSTALVIGTVKKTDKRVVTVEPLGTKRRHRVTLDRIRRAQLLGDVDGAVVAVICRHHVAAVSIRAHDIGLEWG